MECRLRVGLLDADVHGPSMPDLVKLEGRHELDSDSKMIPLENYGVRCMSMGFLMEKDSPAVWRGLMILGLIENMSFFKCPSCGERSHIFSHGGARATAEEMDMDFLGEVPLNIEIRETSDAGSPIVASAPTSEASKVYRGIAVQIAAKLKDWVPSGVGAGLRTTVQ